MVKAVAPSVEVILPTLVTSSRLDPDIREKNGEKQ